jgi:hypothetical protein
MCMTRLVGPRVTQVRPVDSWSQDSGHDGLLTVDARLLTIRERCGKVALHHQGMFTDVDYNGEKHRECQSGSRPPPQLVP